MRKEKWLVAAKKADFNDWANVFHISPVLARIIRNRDVTDPMQVKMYLHGTMEDCHSPWLLQGMEQAVEMIRQGAVGSLVDVETEDTFVKIEVVKV